MLHQLMLNTGPDAPFLKMCIIYMPSTFDVTAEENAVIILVGLNKGVCLVRCEAA